MKKKYFLIGGLVLLLMIGWAFYWYNKPHRNTAHQDADFQLSATELYAAFQKDEAASDKKYLGKVIEVNGTVSEIETAGGNINVLMNASAPGGINCSFSKDGLPASGPPKKGSLLTIKGRCTGFLMDVNLVDCVLKQ